jgi:hypothetical protein
MILSRRLMMAAASFEYNNFALFTASGTFNVPAGVTTALLLYSGGGGGGGKIKADFYQDRHGGTGGMGFQQATLTPGAAETITIGAGGTGFTSYNTGNGTSGGSTAALGFTATGGAGGGPNGLPGADGTATSFTSFSRSDVSAVFDLIDASDENKTILGDFDGQSTATPDQGPPTVYSQAGSYKSGNGGISGWARTSNDGAPISDTNGRGGIGGFAAIWY